MKIAILCVLFTATLLHAFTVPRVKQVTAVANQPTKEVQSVEPDEHKIDKRFIGSTMLLMNALLDDDDYFDEFTLNGRRRPSRRTIQLAQMIRQLAGPQGLTRAQVDEVTLNGRRRPSRRTIQLAQMIRQLAGPQGLTRAQMQNMLQNLQNLQAMQQLQSLQTMQGLQQTLQPQAG